MIDDLVAPGRTLRVVDGGLRTALAGDDHGAPYDRHAAVYDRLIGNRAYNRLLWGLDPAEYRRFADESLAAGTGPFLDAGCGTAIFTAAAYRRTTRPLVLVDRSLGMLDRAAAHLGDAGAALVQADLFDLPFAPGRFDTVACFAMLHVLDDPWGALAALRPHVTPGGRFFASMLVRDRGVGRAYQRLLQRAGELGPPRSARELEEVARGLFGGAVEVRRTGSMAWVRATAPG